MSNDENYICAACDLEIPKDEAIRLYATRNDGSVYSVAFHIECYGEGIRWAAKQALIDELI